MSNSEARIELYKLYKDEIKREDDIVFQRNMSSLTFQGFLFASATFLISNPWFKDVSVPIYPFRQFVLLLQGITGLLVALVTTTGVMAAASSIEAVSKAYARIPQDPLWPQLHGGARAFRLGGAFAVALNMSLAILWSIYEVVLIDCIYPNSVDLVPISSISFMILVAGTYFGTRRCLMSSSTAGPSSASGTTETPTPSATRADDSAGRG